MPSALIVIDMQVGSFGKESRRHDAPAWSRGSMRWPVACARPAGS